MKRGANTARRSGHGLTRALACLAVVPIGLGPSVVAFAQEAPADDASIEAPAAPPVITAPPTTPAPTTAAPTTAAPATAAPTSAAPTTAAAMPTDPPVVVDPTDPATTAAPVTTVTEPNPDQPTTTVSEPATGTTVAPDPTDSTPTDSTPTATEPNDPDATDDGSSTTIEDPSGPTTEGDVTTTSGPDGADIDEAEADGSTTVPTVESTTTLDPKSTTTTEDTAPANLVVVPPETLWTISLQVNGGWNYSNTMPFYLRNRIAGTSDIDLNDGETSIAYSRRTGQAFFVRSDVGSSATLPPFEWRCTGDVSGLSTGVTKQFTPTVDPFDSTMDCVFVIDNTNPPTVNVETVVEGDPGGLVAFSTTVAYSFFGNYTIETFATVDATTRSLSGIAGFAINIASVATGATPGNTRTSSECFNSAGNYIGGSGLSVGISSSNLGVGTTVRCVITHSIPATLTIVEDVVPDDPSAPAADYSKSRFTAFTGPDAWTLADGESQSLEFGAGGFGDPSFSRTETPGWDATRLECNEILAGGATQPYSNFDFSPGTSSARASFPKPPAGTDLVCRFIVEPAGPPSLNVNVAPNVFDQSAFDDFEVTVLGPFGVALDTLTFPASGASQTLPLEASGGNHTLQLVNDQGLDILWACDAVVSTTNSITFPTVLGETVGCSLSVSDPFPTGTGSIRLIKDEEPDSFESYDVRVTLGDYMLGSGRISDGGFLLIDNIAPGVYTVTESGRGTNYELASVTCVDGTASDITRTVQVFPPREDMASIRTGSFTLDAVGPDTVCTLVNSPSTTPAIVRIETVTEPAGVTQSFDYSISPVGNLTTGTSSFSQVDGDIGSRGVRAGFLTITQDLEAGFTTQSGCEVTGSDPDLYGDPAAGIFVAPGVDYTCRFVNTSTAATSFDLTIESVVDTGVVDLSSGFDFLTDVSGPGVDGATAPGTSRTFLIGDADMNSVSVLAGTDVTFEEVDDLAGDRLFRTTIDCGAAAPEVVNAASTFTMAADVTCIVTFAARTLTVQKLLESPVIGGFDEFEFSVSPVIDYTGNFTLFDGDETTLVVPLGETVELSENDTGPYDVEIDCTIQVAGGPTRPSTGPFEPSNVIEITDLANSYRCDVYNYGTGAVLQEVTVTSNIDLGPVALPEDLPGFFVDFDGDFPFDGEGEEQPVERGSDNPGAEYLGVGPGTPSLHRFAVSTNTISSSSLLDSRFIDPNGSVSVLVADGSALVIDAGSGADRFANSFVCTGGADTATTTDGSVSLTGITGPVECELTSAAGVLEVVHEVEGSPAAAAWPFTITEVIAGDESVSLGDDGLALSAVVAARTLQVSLTDVQGATSVASSCQQRVASALRARPVVTWPPFGKLPVMSSLDGDTTSVSVPGGATWRCTFTTTYDDATTTATTTTPPTTTPATMTPTTTTATPTTTTPTTPTTAGPTTTTSLTPAVPFAPTASTPTPNATPATPTSTTVPDGTEPPPAEPPADDPPPADEPPATDAPPESTDPPTINPDDPPAAITVTDEPEDIYVDIGDPIPVDVDCAGELVITVNGERQDRVDQIEPSALGLGDHVINVSCDGEQITSVRAVVFEQEESSPGGRNMTVIVMFVVMASAAFLFAPSAAGRKRLPA